MRVLITGATGFIGRALVPVLRRDGHQLATWARSEKRARNLLGLETEVIAASANPSELRTAVAGCDAVINLAGAPVAGRRWTAERRRELVESRVQFTQSLVGAISEASPRPAILISGSAVGYYGDRGGEIITEASKEGSGFLARLCLDWEEAANLAGSVGLRVATLRIGVVLGADGGALEKMIPAFRLGIGGPLGSGRQYMPWIHLHDLVEVIAKALIDERYQGPINGVAPQATTNREFARALGRSLHRPSFLAAPELLLRTVFGASAEVMLSSQRVHPQRLCDLGFPYQFPRLEQALADVVRKGDADIRRFRPSGKPISGASGSYLEKRRPVYQLSMETLVDAPIAETFRFFSRAENLGLITPAALHFEIQGPQPSEMSPGTTIEYRLRIGPLPIHWRTAIVLWDPPRAFVDVEETGPYRCWWHQHTFSAQGGRTLMRDEVRYAPPFGVVGRLAHRWFIAAMLQNIFHYRGEIIRLRFGAP